MPSKIQKRSPYQEVPIFHKPIEKPKTKQSALLKAYGGVLTVANSGIRVVNILNETVPDEVVGLLKVAKLPLLLNLPRTAKSLSKNVHKITSSETSTQSKVSNLFKSFVNAHTLVAAGAILYEVGVYSNLLSPPSASVLSFLRYTSIAAGAISVGITLKQLYKKLNEEDAAEALKTFGAYPHRVTDN